MSIATELQNLNDNILDAYDAVQDKGGTAPANKNMTNLPTAISSIPSGGGVGIPREVDANGMYIMPAQNFSFSLPSGATDVGESALSNAFYGCRSLTSVDLSTLTALSENNALSYAFYYCTNIKTVDLSSLATVSGNNALNYAFYNCRRLASVDLSSLTTASGSQALSNAFNSCISLTSVDLSSLTTVSGGNALSSTFNGCSSLTSVDLSALTTASGSYALSSIFASCSSLTSVNFSSLAAVKGNSALRYAFQRCTSLTSISFPALTTSSFGSNTDQFNFMLSGCSDVTVHFPAAIQSTIGSWSSVTSGFGGTNTTVLFDL